MQKTKSCNVLNPFTHRSSISNHFFEVRQQLSDVNNFDDNAKIDNIDIKWFERQMLFTYELSIPQADCCPSGNGAPEASTPARPGSSWRKPRVGVPVPKIKMTSEKSRGVDFS